jgi:hypothetical protein
MHNNGGVSSPCSVPCLYKPTNTSKLRGEKKEGENAARLLLFPAKEEAKASVMHPFISESNTE